MTDNEIRRKLLEHAYIHRHELTHGIVSRENIEALRNIHFNIIFPNMSLLSDEGYIKIEDGAWTIYSLTTYGLRLLEDKNRFNSEFPINPEETDFTSTTFQTAENLILERFPEPFKTTYESKIILVRWRVARR